MNVLIACEFSGVVRDAFRRRGHYAVSCDLLPSETPGPHYWGDIFDVLNAPKDDSCWYGVEWDLMIAHPPCTYLSVSGLHWNGRIEGRKEKTEDAIDFVQRLLGAQIPRIALENPVGILSTRIRKPDQIIQPYNFGADASKKTCLWLKSLPLLQATEFVPPRIVAGRKRWGNQTDSGQNVLGPSDDRWKLRSRTYEGIAEAMAEQWGGWMDMNKALNIEGVGVGSND
jgi:site-specific DNA-cytosine methylase